MSRVDEREAVRTAYAELALRREQTANGVGVDEASASFGYSDAEIESVPDGANLGLGCGNPLALDDIRQGDVVLDLGSGAGFDCFLAAQRVGPTGRVIGVDMTPEMLDRARSNAEKAGYDNVEFRHGVLEELPVESSTVDLVISNCVISLVPDRAQVYREALRVLKPGGRIAISDTLVDNDLPAEFENTKAAHLACLNATGTPQEYVELIEGAGFTGVRVVSETRYPTELAFEDAVVKQLTDELGVPREAIDQAAGSMLSVSVVGQKPA